MKNFQKNLKMQFKKVLFQICFIDWLVIHSQLTKIVIKYSVYFILFCLFFNFFLSTLNLLYLIEIFFCGTFCVNLIEIQFQKTYGWLTHNVRLFITRLTSVNKSSVVLLSKLRNKKQKKYTKAWLFFHFYLWVTLCINFKFVQFLWNDLWIYFFICLLLLFVYFLYECYTFYFLFCEYLKRTYRRTSLKSVYSYHTEGFVTYESLKPSTEFLHYSGRSPDFAPKSLIFYDLSENTKNAWGYYYHLRGAQFKKFQHAYRRFVGVKNVFAQFERLLATKQKTQFIRGKCHYDWWDVFKGRKVYRFDILEGLIFQLVACKAIWKTYYYDWYNDQGITHVFSRFPERLHLSTQRVSRKFMYLHEDEWLLLYARYRQHSRHIYQNTTPLFAPQLYTVLSKKKHINANNIFHFVLNLKPKYAVDIPFMGQVFLYFDVVFQRLLMHNSFHCVPFLKNRIAFFQKSTINFTFIAWTDEINLLLNYICRGLRLYYLKRTALFKKLEVFVMKARLPPYMLPDCIGIERWRSFVATRFFLRRLIVQKQKFWFRKKFFKCWLQIILW